MVPTPHDVAPTVTRNRDVADVLLRGAPRATREAFVESAHFKAQVDTLVAGLLHAVDALARAALEAEERRQLLLRASRRAATVDPPDLGLPAERVLHRDPEVHPVDEDGGDGL